MVRWGGRGGGEVSVVSRRRVQTVLGVLSVLDGALQLQPFMFEHGFA
jgi:hypothetical protein